MFQYYTRVHLQLHREKTSDTTLKRNKKLSAHLHAMVISIMVVI